MEKIKAAVVGLGRIASLLEDDTLREKPCTHTGAIASNDDCILVAGSDTSEERRKLFAEKWKVPVYEDARQMLAAHKPQILVIATHPDSHFKYCLLASQEKVPVVICEKPLADNLKEARKIASLTQSKDSLIIITNHERRYSQDYIRAKEILKEGKLGAIISVRALLYMGRTRRILDMLWHDGTHLADAIMFLTDSKIKHKRVLGAKLKSNKGTAWLEAVLYKDKINFKIPIIFEIGAERDHLVFEIEFSCEKGKLRIGNGVFEVYESVLCPYAEKFRSLQKTNEEFKGQTGYFANMLKDAVLCVKDPEHIPVSGAIDGLKVIEYLQSIKAWNK